LKEIHDSKNVVFTPKNEKKTVRTKLKIPKGGGLHFQGDRGTKKPRRYEDRGERYCYEKKKT